MPGKAGRFDGKGGGWRDILRRWQPLRHLVEFTGRAYYVINQTRLLHAFFASTFVKGHYRLYVHPGNSAVEPLDRRE